MHALTKSHKSTVCIIPPLAVQQAVQKIRCFKDKSFVRWPPHINLLYPFLEDQGGAFTDAAAAAATAVAHIPPFKVQLSSLSFFEHASSYTLWLDAADKTGLAAVQSALQAAFPACTDLSDDPQRNISGFMPHMSLGQWHNKKQLLSAMQEYSSDGELLNLEFEVNEVCICSRQGYRDPFTIRYAVPLGTATPSAPYPQPQLVDAPYIATTNRNLPSLLGLSVSPTDKRRFGLGGTPGAPSGVWNFACGANMNPNKLGGSRGLTPQESLPGELKGYRLAFNHRGGFGNVVPLEGDTVSASAAEADHVWELAPAEAAGELERESAAGTIEGHVPRSVHGLLHRLSPADNLDLMCMEHEYEPVVVMVQPYHSTQQQQQQQREEGEQEQQQLVPAIVFQSPPERVIKGGLPPTRRYLTLLREGAQHWKLEKQYTNWLDQHPEIAESSDRGVEYYTSPTGGNLPAWPKIRTGGSQPTGRGGGRGRGKGRGRGRQAGRGGGEQISS